MGNNIDEEMAEAYASKWTPYALYDGYYSYNDVIRNDIKQAFLAGLKAGKYMAEADLATVAYMQGAERYKTKWHNVADGDLPSCDNSEYVEVLTDEGEVVHYIPRFKTWYGYDSRETFKITPPVAWCEIPKFTERKE